VPDQVEGPGRALAAAARVADRGHQADPVVRRPGALGPAVTQPSCASPRMVWIVLSSASRADTRSCCASRRRSALCSDRRPVNDIPAMI
jgi:hypothetical protein